MRVPRVLIAAILVLLVIDVVTSEKLRKYKKFKHPRKSTTTTSTTTESEVQIDEDEDDADQDNVQPQVDPCLKKHCGAGRICQSTEEGDAECICIETCPEETDPRRMVCTNQNTTWNSDCEVYRMRCWCDKGMEKCQDDSMKHLHIEYYGECREMPECSDEEMDDFPRRMRDWLFNIMRDMAERDELTQHYKEMELEAENNQTRRWTNAAIWKWCDLDGEPHDRKVSRHELFPIRAPLMALEHCIAPFLNNCDENDDHKISLKEWGKCLQVDPDEMEDRCEDVRGE
ncbi:SPARC [Neocloeon triangulifer]|uniref:SPARC n=1 Tax=Neocloeon triangulifer TaxID=2078957 RepID=UPI00286FA7D8|nr:SPARC [Neocloeon triangulifer]